MESRGGGSDSLNSSSNIGLKILLENLFLDWPDRVSYQKQQEKFYQAGKKKLREANRLRMGDRIKLTPQEKDAYDYFHGTGVSKDRQNPKNSPCIYDTRQSFLLKMEDPKMRTTFLNSYNNRFQKQN